MLAAQFRAVITQSVDAVKSKKKSRPHGRSLPSWACGSESRHPLRISLLSGAAASRDLLWISSWYGVGGGLGDLLDEIGAAIFSLVVLAQDNDQWLVTIVSCPADGADLPQVRVGQPPVLHQVAAVGGLPAARCSSKKARIRRQASSALAAS